MNLGKEERVTIAIPAYKKTFLKDAIASALGQSYKNIEVIVVDDNSPENLYSIIQEYNDERLIYYKNEQNIGYADPVGNWNRCLSLANGEYFCLLCDDDVYDKTFVEEMLILAKKYPKTNVFRSGVKIIDQKNNLLDFYPTAPEWESYTDYSWAIVSGYRRQTISEFMYRTEYLKKHGGYISLPKAWCSDHISIISLAKDGGIATNNKPLTSFRMSGLNISSSRMKDVKEKIEAQNRFSILLEETLEEAEPSIKKIILNNRKCALKSILSRYIAQASIKDVLFLIKHHKEPRFQLSLKTCIKGIILNIKKYIK